MEFSIFIVVINLFILFATSFATPNSIHNTFSKCISLHSNFSPNTIYTRNNSLFLSVLSSRASNPRCLSPSIPKPQLIFTPLHESEVQAAVICAKMLKLQLRMRSGGHDLEGISYISIKPRAFLVLDLSNFRSVTVDAKSDTAWVQVGATLGEMYYRITQQTKNRGFPAGLCATVGVGGHITGGAYGPMVRKYGVAADNVVDAKIVDVNGRILDRKSMGEDLFWAIRGGGGGSFGVILSWKLKLVYVPDTVTVFTVPRTLEEGGTRILYKYQQIAPKIDENLFIRILIDRVNTTREGEYTIQIAFNTFFLGSADRLIQLMKVSFPELGLRREDCHEMSYINAVMYMDGTFPPNTPPEILLHPNSRGLIYYKEKSDFVKEAIPESGFEGLWKRIVKHDSWRILFVPFGGMNDRIPESQIPFPHRKGVLYKINYLAGWNTESQKLQDQQYKFVRETYKYMEKYVSKSPREVYVNYRDLDIGMNANKNTSFDQASSWGFRYFKNNFKRLALVKGKVDPGNFFWHEQSIPVLKE